MAECKTCRQNLPAGFCHTCFRDFPPAALSPDSRYCLECFDLLTDEAQQAKENNKKRADWWPEVAAPEKQPKKKCAKNVLKKAHKETLPTGLFAQPDSALKTPDGGLKGRPVKDLPVERIMEMFADGAKIPAVMKQLQAEGIKVSRRSLYYIKAGQRVLV